ncbi:MaoC/PaaZ C-terminal domain-containing protein [Anaerolineales bacterium HSG6]|nr:MaoC/PaaZ C-terminal domain-containing protein [Anaerolineales bacterium HSG6]
MTLIVRGMYFEQFEVGQVIQTGARTITETDIVNFAGLSGDFNFIHTNAEAAKETLYGQRIAHGMLVASIATGLAVQQGFIDGTTLAFREINWKFSQAVFIGDTIHVETKVVTTKLARRMGGGLVTFAAKVINQKGEVVQKGDWKMLIQSQEQKND